MMKSLFFLLFFALLFLSGCTAYDTIKHTSFTMKIPQWEQQDVQHVVSGSGGVFASDGICSFNLTIYEASYLAVAQPLFERLRYADPTSIVQYNIFESVVLLTYKLPGGESGEVRIISCPSGYTYMVDYQCPTREFSSRQQEIDSVLDSMDC